MSRPKRAGSSSGRSSSGPSSPGASRGNTTARVLLLVLAGVLGLAGLATVIAGILLGAEVFGSRPDPTVDGAPQAAIGASSDGYTVWARNDDGTPVRWDPCTEVPFLLNLDGAPAGFRAEVDHALEVLRDATGLELTVTGETDERPAARRPPYQPEVHPDRWAPILVAWASPHEQGLPLRDVDRAIAIPVAVGPEGDRTYVSGQVVFNRDRDDLRVGDPDRGQSWTATVLHELGHVLGLGHVADETELMWTYPGEGEIRFGAGDLAGLDAVGAGGGCRDLPAPHPVDVGDVSQWIDRSVPDTQR